MSGGVRASVRRERQRPLSAPLAVVALALACARMSSRDEGNVAVASTATAEWHATHERATRAAAQGRYDHADSVLAAYASRHATAPEAREATFWRALLDADPANASGDLTRAQERLRTYVANGAPVGNRTDAEILLRLIAALDSARAAAQRARVSGTTTTRESELVRENQRLKEQLDQATAELERIRRRIGAERRRPGRG